MAGCMTYQLLVKVNIEKIKTDGTIKMDRNYKDLAKMKAMYISRIVLEGHLQGYIYMTILRKLVWLEVSQVFLKVENDVENSVVIFSYCSH